MTDSTNVANNVYGSWICLLACASFVFNCRALVFVSNDAVSYSRVILHVAWPLTSSSLSLCLLTCESQKSLYLSFVLRTEGRFISKSGCAGNINLWIWSVLNLTFWNANLDIPERMQEFTSGSWHQSYLLKAHEWFTIKEPPVTFIYALRHAGTWAA